MSNYLVKYHLEVPVNKHDGVNMNAEGTLPFVPPIGTHIVAVRGDDFRIVGDVYYSADDGIEIFFEFDQDAKIKQLKKLGWKEIG